MEPKIEKDNLSKHISDCTELQQYLRKKGENHNNYKFYSSIGRIVDIRDRCSLYLGRGKRWNDIIDRENFNSAKYAFVNFGRCFSFSKNESVAMWMLYGGIDKFSGMMDFTKKGMEAILKASQVEIGYFNEDAFFKIKTIFRDSFELYCTDVIYYGRKENGNYYIKRADEKSAILGNDAFDKLIGCKKALPWQYENECRLICRIDRKLVGDECTTVRINLTGKDLGKSFERIYHGPNYPSSDTKNTLPSNLDNSIDWSLCDEHCKLKN